MNIHGYKKKKKSMINLIKAEEKKKPAEQSLPKLRRLNKAKGNCSGQIKELKASRLEVTKGAKRYFKCSKR